MHWLFHSYSRPKYFDNVVEELLSQHDDDELDAQVEEAPGRVAHVVTCLCEYVPSNFYVSGVVQEATLGERLAVLSSFLRAILPGLILQKLSLDGLFKLLWKYFIGVSTLLNMSSQCEFDEIYWRFHEYILTVSPKIGRLGLCSRDMGPYIAIIVSLFILFPNSKGQFRTMQSIN